MDEETTHILFIATADGCCVVIYAPFLFKWHLVYGQEFPLRVAVALAVDVERIAGLQFDMGTVERCAVAEYQVRIAARNGERFILSIAVHRIVAVGQRHPTFGMAALYQCAGPCRLGGDHLHSFFVPRADVEGDECAYGHLVAVLGNAKLAVVAAEEGSAVSRVVGPVTAADGATALLDAHADVAASQWARHGEDSLAVEIDVVGLAALRVPRDIDRALNVEHAAWVVEDACAAVPAGVARHLAALDGQRGWVAVGCSRRIVDAAATVLCVAVCDGAALYGQRAVVADTTAVCGLAARNLSGVVATVLHGQLAARLHADDVAVVGSSRQRARQFMAVQVERDVLAVLNH